MRKLAAWLVAVALLAAPVAAWLAPRPADAAVSIAYTLKELVKQSPRVMLATAVERNSRWEEIAGSRRIVTYTRMAVLEDVVGDGEGEVWVRTLGGEVGRVGQVVSGEATLAVGEKCLVFLTRSSDGVWLVTGMGQGHYPVRAATDSEPERLTFSPSVGAILPRKKAVPAHQQLVGKTVPESLANVRAAKAELDAEKR